MIKVSVCTVTYNHELFIAQAIEGVLKQKVNFAIEMIIGEDCSTDSTRSIVREYAKKYPEIIKPFFHKENVGAAKNSMYCLEQCSGKYIAALEGDDYWTDPLKLQKQVDFLEVNHKYSICFHNMSVHYEDGSQPDHLSNSLNQKQSTTILDLAKTNYIRTASCVFRNMFIRGKIPKLLHNPIAGDYTLHMLNALHGDIWYIPEIMGVYRIHGQGTWSTKSFFDTMSKWFRVQATLADEFNGKVSEELRKAQFMTVSSIVNSPEVEEAERIAFFENNSDQLVKIIQSVSTSFEKEAKETYDQFLKASSMEYRIGEVFLKPFRKITSILRRS